MALTYIGEVDFVQSGPPQWTQGTFDIDEMTVPYSGAGPSLDAFLASLNKWDPSPIDPNMLLTNWRVSTASKVYPQVDLSYIGVKNGVLPPPQHRKGSAVQSGQTTVTGVPVSITYLAPWTETTWITTEETIGGALTPPTEPQPRSTDILTGTVFVDIGLNTISGSGTSFTTQVSVGDIIEMIFPKVTYFPSAPPGSVINSAVFKVTAITNNTLLTVQTASLFTGSTNNTATGGRSIALHVQSIGVTVIAYRAGCGLSTLLTGTDASLWGEVLVTNGFYSFVSVEFSSEEIVPGRYFRNTQRDTVQLMPISC
jgi:hypothetical protein